MSKTSIVHPIYFQIVEKKNTAWYFKLGTVFYNRDSKPVPEADIERLFGITLNKIVIELFRLNGGKQGFYLVNLRDKKYYYCDDWNGVKQKLLHLGIGRVDPMDEGES